MYELQGRVAIVTGGSRGIGRAIVLKLAQAGAKVVINYQGNEAAAQETLDSLKELGGEGSIYRADVSSSAEVEEMMKTVLTNYGQLDILINNAGITRDNLLMRLKDEDWQQVINTNLTGVFNCCRAACRPMIKKRSGRIVNISSVVGLEGNAGQVNYAAAKAGIIGLSKSLAKELASRAIMVNAVAPGFIQTEMTEQITEAAKKQLAESIPLGHLGNPDDVANMVLFLVSDAAQYITGQVIAVDGGMTMQ